MTAPPTVNTRPDLECHGVAETELGADILGWLPEAVAPAPWTVAARAVMWTGRANRHVVDTLPQGLRGWRPLVVSVALVRYSDTPVGPYDEVVATVILRKGGRRIAHVPLIAVDSADSVVGGRANWHLPKTMARFEGSPAGGTSMAASGEGFEVRAQARALGPGLPARSSTVLVQEAGDGRLWQTAARMSARVRPALVHVEFKGSPELARWLPSGRFLGLIAERAEGSFGEPTAFG